MLLNRGPEVIQPNNTKVIIFCVPLNLFSTINKELKMQLQAITIIVINNSLTVLRKKKSCLIYFRFLQVYFLATETADQVGPRQFVIIIR